MKQIESKKGIKVSIGDGIATFIQHAHPKISGKASSNTSMM
jgi:hypothetical protein